MSASQATTAASVATTAATITTTKAVMLAVGSAVLGVAIGIGVERRLLSETLSANMEESEFEVAIVQPKDASTEPPATADAMVSDSDAAKANIPQDPPIQRSDKNAPISAPAGQIFEAADEEKSPAAREAHLIDRARSALRRGLIDEALLALMQHERKFPGGQLAEERDVLIIETYVTQGNTRIAKRRIQRYRKQYPKGFHRNRVHRSEQKILDRSQR